MSSVKTALDALSDIGAMAKVASRKILAIESAQPTERPNLNKLALDVLKDIECAIDLKRLFRDRDGARMDVVVQDVIEALEAAMAAVEAAI